MHINVEHIARLARLGLSDKEKELFEKQLSSILGYAETINRLETSGVEPTSHAIPMKNVLREDKAVPCEDVEAILKNAPEEEDHMFKVPRIIENE
ncbi:MAG: Asp-tRNA(Asn)/Glu-tRNA(Gln) amidotransferase subunit GatC [Candidatus Margulisbacteria bacterium]|nr:Asp-tRNA(Asn)/Glu-tRNA(Gln) amidotransferase subunit GatC [Candidatus Margulisiibacteriota bacterium]